MCRWGMLLFLFAGCEPDPPPPSLGESTLEALAALEAQQTGGTARPERTKSETRAPSGSAAETGAAGPGALRRTVHAFYRSFDGSSTPAKGDLEIAIVFDYDRENLHAFSVGRGARILDVVPATPPGGPEVALPLGEGSVVHRYGVPAGLPPVRAVRLIPTDGSEANPMTPGPGMRSRTDYLHPIAEGRALFVQLELDGNESVIYPIVRGGAGIRGIAAGEIDRGDVPRRVATAFVYLENLRRVLDWLRSEERGPYPVREAQAIQ